MKQSLKLFTESSLRDICLKSGLDDTYDPNSTANENKLSDLPSRNNSLELKIPNCRPVGKKSLVHTAVVCL